MGPHWSFLIFAFHPDTTNVHTLQWSLDLSFISFPQQNFEWWNSQSCHYCHKYCLNGQAVKGQHFLVWCSNHLSDDLVSFLPFLQQELEELFGTSCPAGAGIYRWKSFKTVHLFYSLLSLHLKTLSDMILVCLLISPLGSYCWQRQRALYNPQSS